LQTDNITIYYDILRMKTTHIINYNIKKPEIWQK